MRTLQAVLMALAAAGSLAAAEARVAIIAGPSNHPPGTHEVAAGARLMQWALENMANVRGVKAEVYTEWPKDARALEGVKTLVFIGDIFPPQKMAERDEALRQIGRLMERGVGIACVHYATGLRAEDVAPDGSHPLLGWLGGYFGTRTPHHQSVAKVFPSVTITPGAAGHAVARGWREFTVDEEPYYNNYFGAGGNQPGPGVTVLATAMLPPEAPKREIIAWGAQRKDGGRGFGIVMPHFYRNWGDENMRRLILNGIVWTAKMEVPKGGVETPKPDLARFEPESVEPKARAAAK